MKSMIRIQSWVLITGILLMVVKAIAYFITSSNVILTDALESIINILAGSFALYSLILTAKPRDTNHPYGHGKIEFISASIEAGLIMTAGVVMAIKAVYNLIFPQEIQAIEVGIYLTGAAGLVNFILGGILVANGKKHNSIIMEADGKHLLSDAYSTVGMIIGLTAIYITGQVWLDNAVAILFGVVLIYTGAKILRKSIPGIMDEADMLLLGEVVQTLQANRQVNWIDLHNLRLIKYGNIYHIDCHITLPWYFSVKEAHDEMKKLEFLIQSKYGSKAEMFIHNDPCHESSCQLCSITDCKVRKQPFKSSVIWNLQNVLENKQHQNHDGGK